VLLLQRTPPWLRWSLTAGWAGVIFLASATPNLRVVPLAQRFGFLPAMLGLEATGLLELVLRKGAHMFSFGMLALLLAFALSTGRVPARRVVLTAFGLTVLYALTDEYHQTFVPTREGTFRDVFIDATGAAIALALNLVRSARPH